MRSSMVGSVPGGSGVGMALTSSAGSVARLRLWGGPHRQPCWQPCRSGSGRIVGIGERLDAAVDDRVLAPDRTRLDLPAVPLEPAHDQHALALAKAAGMVGLLVVDQDVDVVELRLRPVEGEPQEDHARSSAGAVEFWIASEVAGQDDGVDVHALGLAGNDVGGVVHESALLWVAGG